MTTPNGSGLTGGGLTGGSAVVQALGDNGVDVVFGIPGTHNLEIYRALAGSRIRHVTPRHEQGAGYAADGYARVTGRPGVCVTTSGPGLTNVTTAAATAYADSIPLLVVSPGVPLNTHPIARLQLAHGPAVDHHGGSLVGLGDFHFVDAVSGVHHRADR